MLTYSLHPEGSESLYEQLYRQIRADIEAARLAPHAKLPSKRALARHLGLSNTTVESAYAQLLTEGYLYSLPKRGHFVSPLARAALPVAAEQGLPAQVELSFEPKASEAPYFADLLYNGVSAEHFPFATWMKLLRQVMSSENEARLLSDRPSGGVLPLRRAIAAHLQSFRGMQVSPDQVIVGAGTEYLYAVLIQLLGRSLRYGVEDPGYRQLSRIYARNDVHCQHLPMDAAGVQVADLERLGTNILHITPSHHFPTGLVMPISRRYELLAWSARAAGRYIIEDDYDCEFRLSGKPIPTLQSIDPAERVIYLNTFSQSLAPAFRISYLVLPKHLARRFYEILGFYSGTVSCFEQLTLSRFLDGGYFEKHLSRMRTHYRALRDQLLAALRSSPLAARVRIIEEEAGVHFLLEVDTTQSDEALLAAAAREGLRLSCLSDYYEHAAEQRAHVLLINYAGLPSEKVSGLVARLCRCIL